MLRLSFLAPVLALLLCARMASAQTININTASQQELETLPGVNTKLAADIVNERETNGAYARVEDLQRVNGVSEGLLAKLRARLSVGSEQAFVVRPGSTVTSAQVAAALKPYAAEPSIREVQQAAIDYAGAHPDRIDSWRARAANRAFAPAVTLGLVKDWDHTQRLLEEPGTADRTATYNYDDWSLRATAEWDLDRAVFDPEEPKVNREAIRLQRYRDDVVDEVTRRFFERRRLQIELDMSPPTDMADRVRKELRLQELTADIDALTGGYLSERLKEIGRDPY